MSSQQPTIDFSKKCEILDKFWMDYRDEEAFESYIEYCDLALPLAFAVNEGVVKSTETAEAYINEAWDLLCETLQVDNTKYYETLDDLLFEAGSFDA